MVSSIKIAKDAGSSISMISKSFNILTKSLRSLAPLLTKTGLSASGGLAVGAVVAGVAVALVNKETNKMVKSFDYLGESLGRAEKNLQRLKVKLIALKIN